MSRNDFRETLTQIRNELVALRKWRESIDQRMLDMEKHQAKSAGVVTAVVILSTVLASMASVVALFWR